MRAVNIYPKGCTDRCRGILRHSDVKTSGHVSQTAYPLQLRSIDASTQVSPALTERRVANANLHHVKPARANGARGWIIALYIAEGVCASTSSVGLMLRTRSAHDASDGTASKPWRFVQGSISVPPTGLVQRSRKVHKRLVCSSNGRSPY